MGLGNVAPSSPTLHASSRQTGRLSGIVRGRGGPWFGRLTQLVRVSALHAESRRFESVIAQMSELLVRIGQLVLSLLLLYVGSEALLSGSVALSIRLHIPRMVIGLTIIALGTSFPELFVSSVAVLRGSGGLAVSNLLGSNIINIGLIMGGAMLLTTLRPNKVVVRSDMLLLVGTGVLLPLLLLRSGDGGLSLVVGRGSGVVLLGILGVYFPLSYIVHKRMQPGVAGAEALASAEALEQSVNISAQLTDESKDLENAGGAVEQVRVRGYKGIVLLISGGVLGLYVGSSWLVESAVFLVRVSGLSERLVAILVAAHGTSAPEIFATLAAIRKGEGGIIVGNVIGSNLMNTLLVMGLIGAVRPTVIPSAEKHGLDLLVILLITLLLAGCFWLTRRRGVVAVGGGTRRWNGALLLGVYVLYVLFLIFGR